VNIAFQFAQRSTCLRGHVGAVIVQDTHVVSGGYNGAPPGQPHCTEVGCEGGVVKRHARLDPLPGGEAPRPAESYDILEFPNGCTRCTHAEANAVAFAARHGTPCVDAVMYCTHSTCANCAALLVACGVRKFVYVQSYRAERLDILDEANIEIVRFSNE
jgi:dCMP deaminase